VDHRPAHHHAGRHHGADRRLRISLCMGRIAARGYPLGSWTWPCGCCLSDVVWEPVLQFVLGFLWFGGFFNLHVTELFGVKDLATLQALDKLRVFVPGNDSYPGVFADGGHRLGIGVDQVLFPPDCSGLFENLKRIFVESLGVSADFFAFTELAPDPHLKSRQIRSYTKHGPKKSDIQCSSSPRRPITD